MTAYRAVRALCSACLLVALLLSARAMPGEAAAKLHGAVAYIHNGTFWVTDLNGGQPQQILQTSAGSNGTSNVTGKMALSLDGRWLFYLTVTSQGQTLFDFNIGRDAPNRLVISNAISDTNPVIAYAVRADSKAVVVATPAISGTAIVQYSLSANGVVNQGQTLITVSGPVSALAYAGNTQQLYYTVDNPQANNAALWHLGDARPIVSDVLSASAVRPFDITSAGRIVYTRTIGAVVSKPYRLVVLDRPNARPREIDAYAETIADPRWSLDGTRIAVNFSSSSSTRDNAIIGADGKGRFVLTARAPYGHPRDHWFASVPYWLPDGSGLVVGMSGYYTAKGGAFHGFGDIWLLSRTGKPLRRLATEATTFTYIS